MRLYCLGLFLAVCTSSGLNSDATTLETQPSGLGTFDWYIMYNNIFDVVISQEPVEEERSAAAQDSKSQVAVFSKHGQKHLCSLPSSSPLEEGSAVAEDPVQSIPELLAPLSKTCFKKTVDWWTYEYCHGKHIRQYHLEGGVIIGEIINIGFYHNESDWSDVDLKTANKHEGQAHIVNYVEGSACDLTNQPRRATVKISCSFSGNGLERLVEPEPCVYLITVRCSQLCLHPLFMGYSSQRRSSITCSPVLSAHDYHRYLQARDSGEGAGLEKGGGAWRDHDGGEDRGVAAKRSFDLRSAASTFMEGQVEQAMEGFLSQIAGALGTAAREASEEVGGKGSEWLSKDEDDKDDGEDQDEDVKRQREEWKKKLKETFQTVKNNLERSFKREMEEDEEEEEDGEENTLSQDRHRGNLDREPSRDGQGRRRPDQGSEKGSDDQGLVADPGAPEDPEADVVKEGKGSLHSTEEKGEDRAKPGTSLLQQKLKEIGIKGIGRDDDDGEGKGVNGDGDGDGDDARHIDVGGWKVRVSSSKNKVSSQEEEEEDEALKELQEKVSQELEEKLEAMGVKADGQVKVKFVTSQDFDGEGAEDVNKLLRSLPDDTNQLVSNHLKDVFSGGKLSKRDQARHSALEGSYNKVWSDLEGTGEGEGEGGEDDSDLSAHSERRQESHQSNLHPPPPPSSSSSTSSSSSSSSSLRSDFDQDDHSYVSKVVASADETSGDEDDNLQTSEGSRTDQTPEPAEDDYLRQPED